MQFEEFYDSSTQYQTAAFGKRDKTALQILALKPIQTGLLPPFRHNFSGCDNSWLKLNEKGELALYIGKQDKYLKFSQDGQLVTLTSNEKEKSYKLDFLP